MSKATQSKEKKYGTYELNIPRQSSGLPQPKHMPANLCIKQAKGPQIHYAERRHHGRIENQANGQNDVQVNHNSHEHRDNHTKADNHVRRLGRPQQEALDNKEIQISPWAITAPPLSAFIQSINRPRNNITHPDGVEAHNKGVTIMDLASSEHPEKAAADLDRKSDTDSENSGTTHPQEENEGDDAVPEVRRQVDNHIVILDVMFPLLGFGVLLSHKLFRSVVYRFTICGHSDRCPHLARKREIVCGRNTAEGTIQNVVLFVKHEHVCPEEIVLE